MSASDQKYARSIKGKYREMRRMAKKRGFELLVSIEQFTVLHQQDCHYCLGRLSPAGYSCDRKNNKLGYTMSNLLPCCARCNGVKSNKLTYKQMMIVAQALGWRK